MKRQFFALVCVAGAAALACARQSTEVAVAPDLGADFGSLNGATLELTADGGIAALESHQIVRHDERLFVTTQRQICGTSCAAPIDSAGGTLSPAATDSLFNIAWSQGPYALKDDYGTTRNAADMMTYTLRVQFSGRIKTIRADDGTMPPEMHKIVDAIRGIISAAR